MHLTKHVHYILIGIMLLSISCKKETNPADNPLVQQYFETNVLNRDFIVSLATHDSADFTANYSNYTFVLLKTDFYHGPLRATDGSNVYMGTWSSNEDYGKLEIDLPVPPDVFMFLSRTWRFTSKNFPTMKLAPWGSTANIVLHMYRK